MLGGALVLLVIFVLANLQTVEVNFLFAKTETPLVIALLVAGGLGALIGWVWPIARAGRRAEREAKGTRDPKQG